MLIIHNMLCVDKMAHWLCGMSFFCIEAIRFKDNAMLILLPKGGILPAGLRERG
jgi:hypothetical protein